MKKTARRILSAILMSSMLLSSGISTIAATEAPVAVESEAPAPVESEAPVVLGETRATVNEAPVEVVTIEENTTPLAPKAETTTPNLPLEEKTTTTSNLPLEGKVAAQQPDEVSVSPDEASPEELSPAMTISSTTYSGVTVEVSADEGVLPSDAHLFVAEIKSHAGKQTAENALGNTDIENDDYMVLDIQIRNGQAEEIEPDGDVRVNIMMDAAKLPEDADESTLKIQHLAEDASGAVKTVETVADNGNATDGSIGVNGDNVEAEFPVGSFSLFTITWMRKTRDVTDGIDSTANIEFTAVIFENDKFREVNPAHFRTGNLNTLDINKDLNKNINNEFSYTVAQMMADRNLLTTLVENGKQYHFQYATYNGNEFDTFYHYPWSDGGGNISTNRNNGNALNGNIHLRKDGKTIDKLAFGKDHTIRLVYAGDEFGTLHPVETISTEGTISMHLIKFDRRFPMFGNKDGNHLYYKSTEGENSNGTLGTQYDESGNPFSKSGKVTPGANYNWTQKFARGQISKGLVSATIPAGQEYPIAYNVGNKGNLSLGEWFKPEGGGSRQKKVQEVDQLFRRDIFEQTGYYYYGSDENGVELKDRNAAKTEFIVYDEIVSPRDTEAEANEAFFYRRGNFLPYNTINGKKVVAETLLDMGGNPLSESDALYGKSVHAPNENFDNKTEFPNDNVSGNYYSFGMNVEATFAQRENGLSEKGLPMMFEFNGDDDFWLYLDGVLVLDLGGNHDAQNGYINFQTGEVFYTDNGSYNDKGNGGIKSNISSNQTTYINYKGETAVLKYDGKTTIRKMFENALGKEASDALDIWGKGTMQNTFLPGTIHTMKIYYMEHGGTASNLRLMFNLPVVETSDLTVSKSFVENGKPKEVPDDFVATFEVYEMERLSDGSFEPKKDNAGVTLPPVGEVRLDPVTAADGTFTRIVENGRTRYEYKFKNLPLSKYYTVVEKIYRSDNGYLNTLMQKSNASDDGLTVEGGKANITAIEKKSSSSVANTAAAGTNTLNSIPKEPTFTHVSEVVRMESKGVSPKVMEVENHYQTTLTIEKHVHSQNADDKETPFEFRLYLKNTDGTPYTEPLGKPVKIGSLEWQQANGQDDLVYPAPGKNYYEFKLKDGESITLAVPNGIKYLVAENVGGKFRVFRPFTNKAVVLRDDTDEIVFDQVTGEALWQDAVNLIPQTDKDKELEGFKTTPEDTLLDDTKITFINERQIVRTGVMLNTAPFMVMLAMVFFAAAGVCVKYLRRKSEEEEI
ncbi:MAG: hypothetical protein IJR58_00410 [Lachnospiraceae bacterium]|nr:hypothetical protein [Lachnospiraceae bacterium]